MMLTPKFITTIVMVLTVLTSYGQIHVDGKPLDDSLQYITIDKGVITGGQNALVSYYTEDGRTLGSFGTMTDESGKALKFSTIVAIIEYVTRNGWELVESFTSEKGKTAFLFKRSL